MNQIINRYLKSSSNLKVIENKMYLGKYSGEALIEKYNSPLYVYLEDVIRKRCREVKSMVNYKNTVIDYSVKANSNIALLKIIKEEGLCVDAMSPGEILGQLAAGFAPDEIFYISNNVDSDELGFAIEKGVKISVDSLSQLERYGRLNPGGDIAVRINPGIGDGHHEKVVTGGAKTKFGVNYAETEAIKGILQKYDLKLKGLNMHIGSNFLEGSNYINAAQRLLQVAKNFDDLDFIDIGGGLGVPYDGQKDRLDLKKLGSKLDKLFNAWANEYGKQITFILEPGRYIIAEAGILLATVNSLKNNSGRIFIGTDAGFSVFARPTMYGAYHEIINLNNVIDDDRWIVDICGNICESGDLLARDRKITPTREGDILAVMDAGAYGFSMASNYNARLRPAEVLIQLDGNVKLIRERETWQDLLRHQIY